MEKRSIVNPRFCKNYSIRSSPLCSVRRPPLCSVRRPLLCSVRLQSDEPKDEPKENIAPFFNWTKKAQLPSDENKEYKTFGKSHSPRLKDFDYTKIQHPIHIVIGSYKKQPILTKKQYAQIIIEELQSNSYSIDAWCLMSDHLHILFNPDGKEINLLNQIKLLKGRTSRNIGQIYQQKKIWQESFYDHILRKDETIMRVSLYILNNPVRKGIVDDWTEYPYSWSKYYPKSSSI